MHKVLEIKKEEDKVYIKVEGINTTFMFDLKEIKDKADLKAQIKYGVECYLKNNIMDTNTKYNELKTLEGTDATN